MKVTDTVNLHQILYFISQSAYYPQTKRQNAEKSSFVTYNTISTLRN